jgi:hypothetical protein
MKKIIYKRKFFTESDNWIYMGSSDGMIKTPWGMSQTMRKEERWQGEYKVPIISVTTASHGGILIPKKYESYISKAGQRYAIKDKSGLWFEEDLAYKIPFFELIVNFNFGNTFETSLKNYMKDFIKEKVMKWDFSKGVPTYWYDIPWTYRDEIEEKLGLY